MQLDTNSSKVKLIEPWKYRWILMWVLNFEFSLLRKANYKTESLCVLNSILALESKAGPQQQSPWSVS